MRRFVDTHGPRTPGPPLPDLPPALAAALGDAGAGSYARGFWRFRAPGQLRPALAAWGLDPTGRVPFLQAAFGHVVYLDGSGCCVLNPVFGLVEALGDADDLAFVLDVLLCDRPALEASFLLDVYEAALPRLGPPGDGEIYSFVPPLGLGGPRDPAHAQRRPMGPELQLLAAL